jgi:hypothetical protein
VHLVGCSIGICWGLIFLFRNNVENIIFQTHLVYEILSSIIKVKKKHEILFSVRCFHFVINHLNAQLNPICHLLALLGAHLILHVSRIRVNILVTSLLLFTCIFMPWFIRYYDLFKIIVVVSSIKFTFILLQRLLTVVTTEAEVRPQTSPYRIYVGQSAVGQDKFLSGYFGFPLSVSFQHCSIIIYSSRYLHNAG